MVTLRHFRTQPFLQALGEMICYPSPRAIPFLLVIFCFICLFFSFPPSYLNIFRNKRFIRFRKTKKPQGRWERTHPVLFPSDSCIIAGLWKNRHCLNRINKGESSFIFHLLSLHFEAGGTTVYHVIIISICKWKRVTRNCIFVISTYCVMFEQQMTCNEDKENEIISKLKMCRRNLNFHT